MKKELLYALLREIRVNPGLRRKAKIFAWAGVGVFSLLLATTIWAGFAAVSYVGTMGREAWSSPEVRAQVEAARDEIAQVDVQPVACWAEVQNLMDLSSWIKRPVAENLQKLKGACLSTEADTVKGNDDQEVRI